MGEITARFGKTVKRALLPFRSEYGELVMADHLDAPGLMPPGGDVRIDITDVYAFQKPGDSNKSILMMNVNPLARGNSFRDDAVYEIKVDTDGDALADVAIKMTFTPLTNGAQSATVRRAVGGMATGRDLTGDVIIDNAPASFGSTPFITENGAYKFFAGLRSDPFFFDLLGFLNQFKFTGSDFFKDKNVFGMVLEVPNSALGSNPNIGIWARTLIPVDGDMQQIDRMGRPAINTVFNHGKDKTRFNQANPTEDKARFTDNVVAVLEAFGYNATEAAKLAAILLPDILTYNYNSSSGFLNGRRLTDDVIDIELGLVTKGAVTTDGVGVHTDLLDAFPYLGQPH